jgi:hypothetical protein
MKTPLIGVGCFVLMLTPLPAFIIRLFLSDPRSSPTCSRRRPQVLEVRHGAVVGLAALLPAIHSASLPVPPERLAAVSGVVCA